MELSPIEAALLRYLADRPGVFVSRDELLAEVWGYAPGVRTRAVDHAVRRLRQKIERDPGAPLLLVSGYGAGYRLEGLTTEPPAPTTRTARIRGREALLASLTERLAEPGVVTLHGPGGAGKTTVAAALAADRAGVVWVDLAFARGAGDLVAAAAEAVGVPLRSTVEASVAVLGEALRARGAAVLVLDNTEQIEGAGPVVAAWSARAPELRVLVTSRRPLGVDGEHIVAVGALEPDPAVDLFLHRAGEVVPGHALVAVELEAVRQLVDELERLPLAIVLAASRVGVLRPSEMLARLGDRLKLLRSRGTADLPVRHRSVQATLEATWRLLSEPMQRAVAWASVVSGPLDAEVVDAFVPLPPGTDGAELLDDLREHSLLEAASAGPRLYASARAFAAAALGDDRDAALAAFRSWLAGRASEVAATSFGPGASEARAWLRRRVPDLVAATDGADPETAARLVLPLMPVREALPTPTLLELIRAARPGAPRALDVFELDVQRARGLVAPEQLAARAEALDAGDPAATMVVAAIFRRVGRCDEAEQRVRSALAATPDPARRALCLDELGLLASRRGDLAEARSLHAAALAEARAAEDPGLQARALGNLGNALRTLGETGEAVAVTREAVACFLAVGNRAGAAVTTSNLGNLYLDRGDTHAAAEALDAALAEHRLLGNRFGVAHVLISRGVVHLIAGELALGQARFHEALAVGDDADARTRGYAWICLAGAAHLGGDPALALERYDQALEVLTAAGALAPLPSLRAQRAAALAALGRVDEARAVLDDRDLDPAQRAVAEAHLALATGEPISEELRRTAASDAAARLLWRTVTARA